MTASLYRVAIVGAATLKGKELKDALAGGDFPAIDVRLLDDDESLGQLDAVGDEATFIQPVARDNFDDIDFAFFASAEQFTRRNWVLAREARAHVIDMSYALEEEAGATVYSPWVQQELGGANYLEVRDKPIIPAHPAATVLALLTLRAQKLGVVSRVAASVMEPASEQGRRGMDELHEQTVKLLSFQQMPTAVYDSQVAFNLLSRYGEKSQPTLESIERRVLRHFKAIVEKRIPEDVALAARSPIVPVPSLMLLQAPVFHGHGFSVYIELEDKVSAGDFTQALVGEHIAVARLATDAPTSVKAAGEDRVLATVRRDATHENGFWIWATADNLRLTALSAIECATAMTKAGLKPR
jgi:aspartate-semialdehyde dehydrogenase